MRGRARFEVFLKTTAGYVNVEQKLELLYFRKIYNAREVAVHYFGPTRRPETSEAPFRSRCLISVNCWVGFVIQSFSFNIKYKLDKSSISFI